MREENTILYSKLDAIVATRNQIKLVQTFVTLWWQYQASPFSTILNNKKVLQDEAHSSCVESRLPIIEAAPSQRGSLNHLVTDEEITEGIQRLKYDKSAGEDMILNERLKYALETINKPLSPFFNTIITTGVYPRQKVKMVSQSQFTKLGTTPMQTIIEK